MIDLRASVTAASKRALLEMYEEEARETDFVMPLSLRARLMCVRVRDALHVAFKKVFR